MAKAVDWSTVQHGLARVWGYCWGPQLQDGDAMSRAGAQQWECPWCRYSLAFWPVDVKFAEDTAQHHVLDEHERELRDLALGTWNVPR